MHKKIKFSVSFFLIAQIIFLCSCGTRHLVAKSQQGTAITFNGKVAEIVERGTILIGTTGDYRPLSFREADVMITEITEAPYYVQTDTRLAAPLLNAPFNHGEIGVLMQKGQEDLLQMVNATIRQMKADGSLWKLHEKYGLVYAFSTDTLSMLRNQIDEIDSQLVDLLAKRMRISREIGQYKKQHGMSIVQSKQGNRLLSMVLPRRCTQEYQGKQSGSSLPKRLS